MNQQTEPQDNNESQQDNSDTNNNNDDHTKVHNIQSQSSTNISNTNSINSSGEGYYDAEKCRAHIANQMRVSKIDRFAAQVFKALEVEADVNFRLANILNMFLKRSAQVAQEFALKCKLGLQNHKQDRILNQLKTNKKKNNQNNGSNIKTTTSKCNKLTKQTFSKTRTRLMNNVEQYTISNDLLYGEGAQLIQELLLGQSSRKVANGCLHPPNQKAIKSEEAKQDMHQACSVLDLKLNDINDTFDPGFFVKKLEGYIRVSLHRSNSITNKLTAIRQIFEKLASEHRAKVDLVYAAEEERQSSTVIRRSAYNLSMAAIKATSTPIHVNSSID